MPSEAQSQEPRDRGPAPPITRAGRSAQRAKATATSSTPERRARGRPRKDGSGSRSAPPAPPPPPPPPSPKSRKKGRTRGRAQAEDEDSVVGTEKNPPQGTDMKEKTTGRRRSTSRRKSNTNPQPSQDRLSPEPEPEPEPDPDPTVPESTLEPSPRTEEEDRTSSAPAAPLPASTARVSPVSPSLDCDPGHSPASSPRPASDPMEEDRPSPSHSPIPMEVVCNPSTVSMEIAGGGTSPIERSPALSSCSSPLVSPCPRLEDEDSLSPLFQRCLSEDSGGSPTPSLGLTKKRLKKCAFCYRGDDEPPLGQGHLVVFGPTPGYIPLHILNRRASSDRDNDCHDHCYRGNQAPPMCSSPEQCESSSEFLEQLGPIGLPHDINVQSLFDPTGQCCAHLQCAAWSEGVCRGEGQSLLYVDKAIDSGSTQVCAFCRRLGASLRCQETSCGRSYHFPCAAATGAQQDWTQRHTLCTRHTHAASSQCVLCSASGDVSGLLMCCCCGNCYHSSCLDPPLTPSSLCRAGWQCPQCRVCQSCRLRGDDGMLLVCERCDKAYHTHCLSPPLDPTPSTGWNCKNCRLCRRCGVRSSGQWANHPFLCESCDPALPCPLCDRTPDLYAPQDCLTCICCYRCVHTECVVQAGEGWAGPEDYVCSNCRTQEEELVPHSPTPSLPLSPAQAPTIGISQLQVPDHTKPPSISHSGHSPVQLIFSEPPQSPTKTISTNLQEELQHSPAPLHSAPTELQHSHNQSHLEPTELQHSPEPPEPELIELQHSPKPLHPQPTEYNHSWAPPHSEPPELQHSPAPPHPQPTDLQHNPEPLQPNHKAPQHSPEPPDLNLTQLQHSPAPPHPETTELQHSPAPSNPETTELQHSPEPPPPQPTELQHSPAPTHPETTELQHSPEPPHPQPTELQHSPEPPPPQPTELQQSPAPTHPETTELQHSPEPPHPQPTELQHSPAPTHPETTELQHSPEPPPPQPTELQHSPAPTHPETTEFQHSPEPPHPQPTELQHSPAPTHPETTELQHNPEPPHPQPTELQHSPAPTHPETTELQHSPGPHHVEPTELQHSPAATHPETTELQHSPAPPHVEPTELQHSPEPPYPDLTKLQHTPASPQCEPTELQHSPERLHPEPKKNHCSPAPPHSELTEIPHSPGRPQPKHSKLEHSPKPPHIDQPESQHSPKQPHIDQLESQHSPKPPHIDQPESQHSPKPPHVDRSESQRSPTPPHTDSAELRHIPEQPHIDQPESQHSPKPPHTDSAELRHIPEPPHIDQPESQRSPTPPHTDSAEHQHSPEPPHIDQPEHQHSPEPPHIDQPEHQHSPTTPHTDPTELQHSPEPPHTDQPEHQHSPTTPHPDPTELQHSPEPPHIGQPEPQHSPTPPHTDQPDPQHSLEPPHIDQTEPQHSLTPPHPDPTELQHSPTSPHPDPRELQHSPTPPHPDPTELQDSPAPTQSESTELQDSPAPSQSESTEPQHSPAPPHIVLTEFQHSPAPSQSEPSELQLSPGPPQPEPTEFQHNPSPPQPEPKQLQHNPSPPQPDPTEVQLKAAVPQPDPRALQQGPAQPYSESTEFQHCSASAHLDPTELHHSPAPLYAESTEAQHSPAPSQQDPVEFQQSPPPSHIKLTELETSPLPSHLDTPEIQPNPVPSHADPAVLQEKLASLNPDPTDQISPSTSHWSLAGLPQSPTQCHSGLTELKESSTVLQQSPTHVTSTQAQHGPHQLSCTSCSPTPNSTEDQFMSAELKQSLMQGSPISCNHGHCPHSPTQTMLNPSQVQPGPSELCQKSPPRSLVPDYLTKTQPVGPLISNVITKPQHIPSQMQHSPLPHSPAQVGTSHPQSPTQNFKPTLDQESPGSSNPVQLRCGPAQDISTLDLDLSPVCCRSTQTARRCASLKSVSAPCSPSPTPPRATQYSLSQPASPVQAHSSQPVRSSQFTLLSSQLAQLAATKECPEISSPELNSSEYSFTQVRPNHNRETLESSAPFSPIFNMPSMPSYGHDTNGKLQDQLSPGQSSALSLDHSSPLHIPPMPTPDSLVHMSTSTEHSSLICSPSADETENIPPPASHIHLSPYNSLLRCAEANDLIQNSSAGSSHEHASQVPTSPTSSPLTSASPMPIEPIPALVENTEQPSSPAAPPVQSSMQPASPLAVLASPIHPISCHSKETALAVGHPSYFVKSEASPSHPNSTPDSPDNASPVHTEAKSGHTLMGSVHAQERTSSPVCSFAELRETQTSQSSHPGQSSPSHVRSTCKPLQTSPVHRSTLPAPSSFSPLHCRLIDTSSASCSTSHSLSHGGQTTSGSSGITNVNIIHSPPRSSHAGQASPVHAQSTSCSAHSGQAPGQTPSSQSMTQRSPVHGPPHTHAQAGEPYCSTNYSPAPDSSTSSGPVVTSLSLEVDMVASSIVQGSVLSGVVQLESGIVKLTDSIGETSPPPASSLPDDLPAVGPNQASLSQVSQTPASPLHIPNKSAVENQPSTAPEIPLYQRPATPVDGTSIPAHHDSPVHSSSTQDNDAMPSTGHTSETSITPPLSPPSQDRPYTLSPHGLQASFVLSSPVASSVCGALQSDDTQVSPTAVCTSPDRPMRCEASPCPIPVSPLKPEAGPGSPQQHTQTEESVATVVICMAEEEMVPQRKSEEEQVMEWEDPQQEELAETTESPEEEEPVEGTEVEDQEKEDQCTSSGCPAAGVFSEHHGPPPPTGAASPLLSQPALPSPQPIATHSALPPPQSSPPQLTSSFTSPQSPLPSPSRAGSLETSPFSPQRTALLSLCSPHTLPSPSPLDFCAQEKELTTPRPGETGNGAESVLKDETLSCHVTVADDDSQSQSQVEPVAVATELTKDTNQSHTEPSETEEEPPETPEPKVSCLATSPEVVARPMRERQYAEEGEEREEREGGSGKLNEEKVEEAQEGIEQEDQSEVEEEEPVSPVLELDPSLDIEVMELMTSSSPPPSLLHLSSPSPPPFSRRGKGRTLRPPPVSSRPSDDLSIRLRQSPFSTEASPETSPARTPMTPPPLSPPSPPLRSSPTARESPPLSKGPPSTVLLFTPKIGMGKPAISKRKFSPGRARIKQGSWWSNRRAVSPPSSSQDSMGEGGWDSPKPRPLDSPPCSMRVGRGSGFPGRRRSRGGGVGGGRGARGRSRLKTQESLTVSPGSVYMEPFQPKEEEENSMHNTVVMFSTSDQFTLKQDMCVVCGSFGQGAEGRLLACSQCGQCYHPYCVNVKITRVVLTKGWRCLECTVCEACGEASDPGRLLLCDDCDISYHTYCLDPPLHTVPKGAWKCKWCVWCVQCGSSSPGLHCDWQSNYSRCGPCDSLSQCPLCLRAYTQDDLILQCQQCDRWVHAVCQGLTTEDEVEVAADEGFDCSLCRNHSRGSHGRSDSFESPFMAQIISRIREPDTKTYTQDGVSLTESGLSHLQSLVEPLMSPRRYRRCKPKLKLRIINQNSVSVLQTPGGPEPSTEQESRGDMECDMKSDSSPERDHAHYDDVTKELEVTDGNKKRKRKPYRPGIGGFMVRQRGGKAGPSRIKLCRKDSSETLPGRDEDVSIETAPPADPTLEKVKKRYRKKKTKLEEAFPSYLQEAFFGRDLLVRSQQVDRRPGSGTPGASQPEAPSDDMKGPTPRLHSSSSMATNAIKKQGMLPLSDGALLDLCDVLNTEPHILATGHTGQSQVERSPSPFAGLHISSMTDDPSLTGSGGRGQRTVQEEPLDAILSPELDKMVTDGAILSKLYKIPELEGKDVEEVFTAVLSPDSSTNQPEQSQHTHPAAGSKTSTHHTAAAFPRLPLVNGLMGAAPHFPNTPVMSSATQGSTGFRLPQPQAPAHAPLQAPAPRQALASQGSATGEGEQDGMSTAQRGMLKWEKEETLGEMATVAPVLYCNTNFPQLREQYPDWSTRVKQIAKLWRKASSQDRAPFVQKARDNRAAQRINKVQLSNDPLKRHQPSPLPGPYDPISMETDGAFRDPLRPKESEQEQEWKLRQQMRQKSKQQAKMEASQKLEQVKNEQLLQQRQQQLLAAQRLAGPLSPETGSRSPITPVAPGNASPLHPPASREGQSRQHLLLQGGQSSGQADDVFLRPQAPPPSGFSSLPHSPHPSSPLHQPPSSPQVFSPPSSRPSSPWDPYNKMAGTPRPTSQATGLPAPQQQQRRNSLSASPAHDAFGSPAPSPDSKTSDVSRALIPQAGLQHSRTGMMTPPSGSTPDLLGRHVRTQTSSNVRVAVLELSGRAGELVQSGLFKTPMPPQHQPQPEVFGSTGARRDSSRPTDLNFGLPQSQDPAFPSSPLSGLGSPHRSPYAQTPGTPRPDYSQQITDPFTQQSPPYVNPQTPGTPRPHSDPTYLATPSALRLDQYTQQSASCRPSPSHQNIDPFSSNPGTPRPPVSERFPRSPGSQRSSDNHAQSTGTPRPSPDPYAQQPSSLRPQKAPEAFSQTPVESFAPQSAGSGSSPLAPETVTFTATHHQLQPSPGQQQKQQQDSFPRTPSSQTPKHPGMVEESSFSGLAGQAPAQDPFQQGHIAPGPSQMDKTTTNEMAALAVASSDGSMSMMPQLGDSEEKLRQRQRLRQLILRQQQQKSALRQEKGLQEGAAAPPAAPLGPPHHWTQEDSSTAPSTDPFGRPPPPYPGTVRPVGAAGAPAPRFPGGFPGEQQRAFNTNEAPLPRQDLPREQGVRGPVLRFAAPPAGLQDSFLRPPQGQVPGSGLGVGEGVSVQMKRPGEFTGIRPLPAASGHLMPGVPQPFLPRSLPLQQHSIMGQPYIELRHRAPENRLRLAVPLPSIPEPEPSLAGPGLGARMGETPLGHQMVIDQQHDGPTAALTQSGESALPGADGIEEHLEDSAVKDLEDVEVKDLVDLNLNLDPEDGKEDLDLGPNDLHLDDFLLSGKFDLIAYADPELNLEDKKDMFNEELDLGEPMEEKEGGASGARKADCQVKQEARDGASVAQQPPPQHGVITSSRTPRPPGAEAADSSQHGASAVLAKKALDSDSGTGALPALQNQEQAPTSGMAPRIQPSMAGGQQAVFQQQQRQFGPTTPQSALFNPHPQSVLGSPQGPPTTLQQMPLQSSQPRLLLNAQTQPPHPGTSPQNQSQDQNQNKHRPLLLEEQPLLLQDLLDQERQEQQQQKQMQALIRQRSTPESGIPNMNFDSISDPIMKAKMVALKGINKVMTQGNLGLNPMVINRFQQAPVAQVVPVAPGPEGPQLLGQDGKLTPQLVRPSPPSFGPGFTNESQRRQYEEWLGETQQLLQMQQRLLEDKIAAHRKTKKSLSAKQRTAKKAGRAFAEEDAAQLRHVTEQQGTVQKQLEQIRKQQKDHSELIEDYRTKQQQQRALQQPPAAPPMMPQTLSQPMVPMQPHQGVSTPAHVPNVPPGWAPGSGGPGVIAQRMAPQMPPVLPNASQAPAHTQTPSAMVPGFTVGPRATSVTAGDGATAPRQVNFDDNNPFSEGFQERERRERLREQQERQRVQLLQEVERHRALQQRLELEQQGLLGAPMGPGLGVTAMPPSGAPSEARVGQTLGPGGPAGSAPAPGGDSLSQMPFFSSELPQDFLQSPPVSRPPPLHQGQAGASFTQHAGLHQGFTGGPQHPGAHPTPGLLPGATAERGRALPEHAPHIDVGPSDLQTRPRFSGPAGPPAQEQVRPAGVGAAGMTLPHPGSQTHRFGHDTSSSSPSTTFPSSFPCSSSGGPPSLIQLYSDIIPDDKVKKKRSRKRDGDDTAGGDRTPLSSHSDDVTAPPTPAVSDTSCSTPTRGSMDQSDASFSLNSSLCSLAPSSELEKQLCVISAAQQRGSVLGMESVRAPLSAPRLEVKEEREEGGVWGGDMVKMEEGVGEELSSPSSLQGGGKDGDGGKELLRHLLKDKTSPGPTLSPTSQAPPTARRQLSTDSVRSEEDRPGSNGNMENSQDLLDSSDRRKPQRCKRLARLDKGRAPPKHKRRKREEEDKTLHSSTTSSDPLMTHLTQLSVLPLMEPVLGVDLSLFPPYGSASLGRDSRLTGSFGNASLNGVTDFYSQLIYKQNNLSNPPTPPASLPPTPPPVARQKLVNGFATTEELSRKDMAEQDGVKQKGEGLVVLNHASKTVDVPASLPTPPHNNQEELRVQESSECDSPDGYVPSSSPESVADMEVSRYPDLSFIKLEPPSPCPSPALPIMPSAWGKASAVKQEVKAEPTHRGHPSCSNTDLVTIAITVNPVAAQNVAGVMAAVAELLRVPVPGDYQLNRPAGPERSSLALLAGVRVPLTQGSTGSRQQRPPPAAGNTGVRMDYIQHGGSAAADAARPQCCSYCKELLVKGVHIVKELKQEGHFRPGPNPVFCSPNCSARYSSDLQSRAAGDTVGHQAVDPIVLTGSERPPPGRVQHQYTNNMSSIAVHSLLHTPSSPPSTSSSPPLSFPPASSITMETKPRIDSLKVKVKLKPRPRAVPGVEDSQSSRQLKRMKCCRWRRWSVSIMLSRGPCIPNEAVAMPTEDEVDVLLKKFGACLRPDPLPKDQRRCCFCNQQGDGQTDGPARLLNLDLDLWVHLNCALWSSEVYETQAGALINVELALRRGLTLRCAHCQQTGATSGCNRLRCTNTYHFTCALQAHCTFFKDKTMLCHLHKPRMVPLSGDRSSSCSPSSTPGPTPDPAAVVASDPYDSELRCFAVFRRVFVQRDEARQIAALVQRGERQHTFRVGSLLFRSIGRLLPQQMSAFHNKTAIFPIGYHANRIYWSMRHSTRRCKYMCYIEEQEGHPLFKVKVVEKGYDDHILTGATPKAVWDQILEPVAQLRSSSGTLKLFPVYLKGEDLFGLTTSAVTRIMESLPGVESCERYTFRYGRNPLMEWPLAFNPSGSARSEPKACQSKRPNLLTSIAPRCQGTVGSIVGLVPGVVSLSPGESVAGAHQGRHSKSSQYRRMKAEWKTNVYLARSRIQGLGLYAARDIEKCTMVIEYIGTIIRSEVANRKERLYESQNRGVYMFRIDNDYVIDATITGGPARYINHSCSPNCITEVVTVEKENKIIISSCRRIQRGEELSYDYKFDLEDDQHKIPCHCGAVNCRKWMN